MKQKLSVPDEVSLLFMLRSYGNNCKYFDVKQEQFQFQFQLKMAS